MAQSEMPIFTRTFDFLTWLLPVSNHFPRAHRRGFCFIVNQDDLASKDIRGRARRAQALQLNVWLHVQTRFLQGAPSGARKASPLYCHWLTRMLSSLGWLSMSAPKKFLTPRRQVCLIFLGALGALACCLFLVLKQRRTPGEIAADVRQIG
jgi:hypothetical protein